MTTALTLFAAFALPVLAQQAPAAPKASSQVADVKYDLKQAVFAHAGRQKAPSFAEVQKRREDESFQNPGHRVVTEEELEAERQPPAQSMDRFQGPRPAYDTVDSHRDRVELSFLHPVPGLDAGVGFSSRKDWVGGSHSGNDRGAFVFLSIPLDKPAGDQPVLTMPEARVSSTRGGPGNERTTVDSYTVRDLPPVLQRLVP